MYDVYGGCIYEAIGPSCWRCLHFAAWEYHHYHHYQSANMNRRCSWSPLYIHMTEIVCNLIAAGTDLYVVDATLNTELNALKPWYIIYPSFGSRRPRCPRCIFKQIQYLIRHRPLFEGTWSIIDCNIVNKLRNWTSFPFPNKLKSTGDFR